MPDFHIQSWSLKGKSIMHIPPKITLSQLKEGMIIVYLLRPNQRPVHPEQEWRGKISKVCQPFDAVEVDVLNKGFEGCKELVYFIQIVRLEYE
jgi:hypothetical protein